ncbi:MAG TPA: universal stress protein [Anaerolineae bacterium]
MFAKILVPLDRSSLAECVLPHAIALAGCLDAQLMLLHVLSLPARQDRLRAVDPLEWQLRRAEAESYLQEVCLRVRAAGVPCEAQVRDGDAAEQIVDCARDLGVGLVIMASHGQSGLSDWHVSSVVQKVIVRANTSLMIVRAQQPAEAEIATMHYRRILVPLDSSARAESVLPLATALARVPNTDVLLTHVVQRPQMPRRTPPSREDSELAARLVERNSSEAAQYLELVRSQLPAAAVETRLLIGDHVAGSLHELVDQEQIDLVLLSAHGYSGRVHWPYGGLVASFIAYSSAPLVIFQDAPVEQAALTQTQPASAVPNDGRR